MLGAMAGGEALEIIVALKDLASGGFSKVETNLKHMEGAANNTNLGGLSKGLKTAETDATKLAGKEVKGGGGIGGLAAGMTGLAGGPLMLATGALAALSGAGLAVVATYDKVVEQQKALAIAAKDHGIALTDLTKHVDSAINANAQYGFGAEDTRGAIIKLTEAGLSLGDQQASMNNIMDLASAKNMSLTDTAKMYELALMGNAKALKDLGIQLPKIIDATAAHDKAQRAVDVSTNNLASSQAKLKLLQDQLGASTGLTTAEAIKLRDAHQRLSDVETALAGKHKLTQAEAIRLRDAHQRLADATAQVAAKHHITATAADRLDIAEQKVKTASDNLTMAQDKLNKAQDSGGTKAERLKQVNDGITKSVGDQRLAVSPLTVAQAELSNMWDKLATKVGPGLLDLFTRLVQGLVKVVGAIITVVSWLGTMFTAITKNNSVGIITPVNNGYGQFGVKNSPVPHMASGGVVTRPTLALLGEGGEREFVIPESKMGMGGGTINFTNRTIVQVDGETFVDLIERKLGARLALQSTSARLGSGA
jgi:predicted  nucleic acid-binding Zn-ribbon protein